VIVVLSFIWAGLTETAAIAAVALNKLPIATVTVREGARSLDTGLDEMAHIFSHARFDAHPHIWLPQLAPYLAAAARSGLSLVWKVVLIVELLGRPTVSASRSGSRSSCSTSRASWLMLSPSWRSCSPWKRFWFSRLNDISPAGAHERLDVDIRQKGYRSAAGGSLHVLGELAFGLKSGEVVALVGPSGCGKTTLLRIISGLDHDFQGRVALPAAGRLGMVFQEPRLLAWRTVEQNVRLAAPRASDDELAALFEMLELTAHRNHYPGELSLGLARRVALARAFAVGPDLLLLDEPFVSLHAELALRLREELAELVDRRSLMTLLVTHNLDEAIGLADRLLFLSPSPARILAEIPVLSPRGTQVPEQTAALRAEIARRLSAAG
jgi:NitT/TauT family transport system ATP-binding protein